VENDAGGDDEAGVREVPCVVNGENPTGILVSHTNVILPLLESLSALKAIVRPIRFAALTSLITVHALERAFSVDAKLVLPLALLPHLALVDVQTSVLSVHIEATLARSAALGPRSCAVAFASLMTGRTEQFRVVSEALIMVRTALIASVAPILLVAGTLAVSFPSSTSLALPIAAAHLLSKTKNTTWLTFWPKVLLGAAHLQLVHTEPLPQR